MTENRKAFARERRVDEGKSKILIFIELRKSRILDINIKLKTMELFSRLFRSDIFF